jgi:FlaA1/EpsC-like NDP-sugar epimerase
VFTLDMGEPVKILDLARDMIELSGLQVGRDIDIAFVELRPGEKLFEELFLPGEQYDRTSHEKIFIARNASRLVPADVLALIADLEEAALSDDTPRTVRFAPSHRSAQSIGATRGCARRSCARACQPARACSGWVVAGRTPTGAR